MRIVYHLGVHCTDEERLIRGLSKNRELLAEHGILIPDPSRYRRLLRDAAMQMKGQRATAETEASLLGQIIGRPPETVNGERIVFSWDSFFAFPQWALRGTLYGFASERMHAFTQLFPHQQAEFHMAIRNPATFLPALFQRQKGKSVQDFMEGVDIRYIRWSDIVNQMVQANPGVPFTIWCDEDTPLIWPEVLRSVSGYRGSKPLEGNDDLLAEIMTPEGFTRMRNYLASHPPRSVAQRRQVVSAFLAKFARPESLEMQFDFPGWTQDTIDMLSEAYRSDIERIASFPGVTMITA